MILEFKNKLNSDFSNFDEVYQQMLLEYNPDNIYKTELMFINSFTSEYKNDEIQNRIQSKKVQWQLLDYYNHFIETNRFLFRSIVRKPFIQKDFKKIQTELNDYLLKYKYIFNKLSEEEKKEFKPDVIDHLNRVQSFQKWTKYKNLFSNAVKQIENDFSNKNIQNDRSKADEVKKESYNHIFKKNAYEIWQSMFEEFGINEKSRSDVKFMFEEMKKEGLIHNTVNQTSFLEWITSTYNGLIVEKTSNHSRTKIRLQAYSRAIQLYKG